MLKDDTYLKQWEEIIEGVDKTNIPMNLVNRLILNFQDPEHNQTIDIRAFRLKGYDNDSIEEIIHKIIRESIDTSGDEFYAIEFFVDVENVAVTVEKETDKLLTNLK